MRFPGRLGGRPKTMFRLHAEDGPTASPSYHAAAHSPRILRPAQQALGTDEVYIHHCKVNMKAAIEGSAWPWHQDFGTWHLDGIEEPSLATFLVMLDEATEMNGCLYFLPGSHRAGRSDPYFDTSTAYALWASKPETMKDAMRALPDPVPVTGPPGTAALFHCNLLHASGHNLSATDRWHAYFCFNACANRPRDVENPRPDYVRSTDWRPMAAGADGRHSLRRSTARTASTVPAPSAGFPRLLRFPARDRGIFALPTPGSVMKCHVLSCGGVAVMALRPSGPALPALSR